MLKIFLTALPLLILGTTAFAGDFKPIVLPQPDTTGGRPLMQVLKDRHSTRDFSADTLTIPVLSNLLWAACGINRKDAGKRTAPSAMNWQEIDVYVATAHGLYLYEPRTHTLAPILPDDIREKTGVQPFVKDVPLDLIYVANYARVSRGSDSDKVLYTAADAALIAENVYLFCASEGLATVVRGSVERGELAKVMKLRPDKKIILTQSVGYPKR
jgi:SagB-type dehydrogenase family enzyme